LIQEITQLFSYSKISGVANLA